MEEKRNGSSRKMTMFLILWSHLMFTSWCFSYLKNFLSLSDHLSGRWMQQDENVWGRNIRQQWYVDCVCVCLCVSQLQYDVNNRDENLGKESRAPNLCWTPGVRTDHLKPLAAASRHFSDSVWIFPPILCAHSSFSPFRFRLILLCCNEKLH